MKTIVPAEPKPAAERTEYPEYVVPVVNLFEVIVPSRQVRPKIG
jgi:hypothetical protein